MMRDQFQETGLEREVIEFLGGKAALVVLFDPGLGGRSGNRFAEGIDLVLGVSDAFDALFLEHRPPGIHGVAIVVCDR